eukprot:TCONS_00014349-protein
MRRLQWWQEGEFEKLLNEAREIQNRLNEFQRQSTKSSTAEFTKHMLRGNIKAALRVLEQAPNGGILGLNEDTLRSLKELHPEGSDAQNDILLTGKPAHIDPIVYESIGGTAILSAALKTRGSAGPSALDADGWRRILASRNYGTVGSDLRTSLANMLKILCQTPLDPNSEERDKEAFLACRLVPLDKNPGVRPIGIGEVLRRIFGKTLIHVIKGDIMNAAGSLQVCAGQQAGSEAAVHAMIFNEQSTDAILLVDASNAFNTLNRNAFLHNIKRLCPASSTYVSNCYQRKSRLFVMGGSELSSSEGTTQGDPMSMPTYAIGLMPLLDLLKEDLISAEVKEAAFADDLAGGGKLINLLKWWNENQQNWTQSRIFS